MCFLGQVRGMLGQRGGGSRDDPPRRCRSAELGDLPGAAMSHGEGLGYFVEMVRGDWRAAEQELRQGYDELESMGDKNYLAITAGWLAHCLYAQGRYDEADDFAGVCESSAAKSWIAAQVLWRGARAMLLARARGRRRQARRSPGRLSISHFEPTGSTRRRTRSWTSPRCCGWVGEEAEAVPIVADALRRYELKEVHPAAARARALLEELAPTAAEETLV